MLDEMLAILLFPRYGSICFGHTARGWQFGPASSRLACSSFGCEGKVKFVRWAQLARKGKVL